MKKILFMYLLFISLPAYAGGWYSNVGIGDHFNSDNTGYKNERYPVQFEGPLGFINIGYKYKYVSINFEHISSIQNKDRGINMLSIRYHLF